MGTGMSIQSIYAAPSKWGLGWCILIKQLTKGVPELRNKEDILSCISYIEMPPLLHLNGALLFTSSSMFGWSWCYARTMLILPFPVLDLPAFWWTPNLQQHYSLCWGYIISGLRWYSLSPGGYLIKVLVNNTCFTCISLILTKASLVPITHGLLNGFFAPIPRSTTTFWIFMLL